MEGDTEPARNFGVYLVALFVLLGFGAGIITIKLTEEGKS